MKTFDGIAIFAKHGMAKFLEPSQTSNSNIIWGKLKTKHHTQGYLCLVYPSGEDNTKSIGEKYMFIFIYTYIG